MRRPLLTLLALLLVSSAAQAQIGSPGIEYSSAIAAGEGGQLFPYDQQDPWIHGQYQRVPAYGGFASFRPYNYRHVFSQTQIASGWGSAHGMPYSQQFWNKYRGSYLQGNLHSTSTSISVPPLANYSARQGIYQTSYLNGSMMPVTGQSQISHSGSQGTSAATGTSTTSDPRPIHIFPSTAQQR